MFILRHMATLKQLFGLSDGHAFNERFLLVVRYFECFYIRTLISASDHQLKSDHKSPFPPFASIYIARHFKRSRHRQKRLISHRRIKS